MAEGTPGKDVPPHMALFQEDHKEQLSDLPEDQIASLAVIRTILKRAGLDEDGNPNIPSLAELYDALIELPPAKEGKRAKLVAETLQTQQWRNRPSASEFDPGAVDDPNTERSPGLPRRE